MSMDDETDLDVDDPDPDDLREDALSAIRIERMRQDDLCRQGRFVATCAESLLSEETKLAVLLEEVGEVARCVLERQRLVNDKHGKDLHKELCQVAAVCLAWMEYLDRTERQI